MSYAHKEGIKMNRLVRITELPADFNDNEVLLRWYEEKEIVRVESIRIRLDKKHLYYVVLVSDREDTNIKELIPMSCVSLYVDDSRLLDSL